MRDLRWRVFLDPRLRHSRAGRIDGIGTDLLRDKKTGKKCFFWSSTRYLAVWLQGGCIDYEHWPHVLQTLARIFHGILQVSSRPIPKDPAILRMSSTTFRVDCAESWYDGIGFSPMKKTGLAPIDK
jgi:hypothetical protein